MTPYEERRSGESREVVEGRALWMDERLRALPPRSRRKIHLDFHNSRYIPVVGNAFDPAEFGKRLAQAHVDEIVVFAKDMHGYFYYPSAYGPVHPGLARDLLGDQVEACRQAGIAVSAYYGVTWDNHLADTHPEWLVIKRDGTTYLPGPDEPPGWTALCLAHPDFVDLVLEHSAELLTRYPLDGIWYDMPLPIAGECHCARCVDSIRADGGDPLDPATQRAHKQRLLTDFLRRSHDVAHRIRPGCQVDQNNQTRLGLAERAPYLDNIDIEALPTGDWGYLYFPVDVRYARGHGVSVYGQTGRFHRNWGDFGGLKHPRQLRAELGAIVAQGANCGVGDQAPPSGRLDAAVYDLIGRGYAEIAALEPYLDQAVPVVEAALLVDGWPLADPGSRTTDGAWPRHDHEVQMAESVAGWTKLLTELRVQFDVAEPDVDLGRYRLVVLPDAFAISPELADRLRAYLAAGGAVIACHDALRAAGQDVSWLDGLRYGGESPYVPAYLVPEPSTVDHATVVRHAELAEFAYALYDGTARWAVAEGAGTGWTVLSRVGEPLFQRSAEHYTSHAQGPFDRLTDELAVGVHGRAGIAAFPVGAGYYRHGYWPYREVTRDLVDAVMTARLVRTSAPISTEVSVTHQARSAEGPDRRPERWLVHLVNWSANRRAPGHLETHEDPAPLVDVTVELDVPSAIGRAYTALDGATVPLERTAGRWCVTVPRVDVHSVVVFEVGARSEDLEAA